MDMTIQPNDQLISDRFNNKNSAIFINTGYGTARLKFLIDPQSGIKKLNRFVNCPIVPRPKTIIVVEQSYLALKPISFGDGDRFMEIGKGLLELSQLPLPEQADPQQLGRSERGAGPSADEPRCHTAGLLSSNYLFGRAFHSQGVQRYFGLRGCRQHLRPTSAIGSVGHWRGCDLHQHRPLLLRWCSGEVLIA